MMLTKILPVLLDALAFVPGILAFAILFTLFLGRNNESLFAPLALFLPIALSFIIGGIFDKRADAAQGELRRINRRRSITAFIPFWCGVLYLIVSLLMGAIR